MGEELMKCDDPRKFNHLIHTLKITSQFPLPSEDATGFQNRMADLLSDGKTTGQSTEVATLAFQSIMYNCSILALWPYNRDALAGAAEDTIGSCVEFANGVVVSDIASHKYYPNQDEASKGWRFEASAAEFKRGYVIKLAHHWEVLLAAPHMMFLLHHPLMPPGWDVSILHPLSNTAAQSHWAAPYAVYNKSAAALLRAKENYCKEESTAAKPVTDVPPPVLRSPVHSKHFIRPGDIVEYEIFGQPNAFGVVMLIVIKRSTSSMDELIEDGTNNLKLMNDNLSDGESAIDIKQAIVDSLAFTRFVPSVYIVICPLGSKDVDEQDDLFKQIRPVKIIDVLKSDDERVLKISKEYERCNNNLDVLEMVSIERRSRLATFIFDHYIQQETLKTSIFNTCPSRLLEIKAMCESLTVPFDGARVISSYYEADLYARVLALSSKDPYPIAKFKSGWSVVGQKSTLYRTPNYISQCAFRESHANSFNAFAGPKLTLKEKASLMILYNRGGSIKEMPEGKERDDVINDCWMSLFYNGEDPHLPKSESTLKKALATNKMIDWATMSVVDIEAARALDIQQSTEVWDLSATDVRFVYQPPSAAQIETSRLARLQAVENKKLKDAKDKEMEQAEQKLKNAENKRSSRLKSSTFVAAYSASDRVRDEQKEKEKQALSTSLRQATTSSSSLTSKQASKQSLPVASRVQSDDSDSFINSKEASKDDEESSRKRPRKVTVKIEKDEQSNRLGELEEDASDESVEFISQTTTAPEPKTKAKKKQRSTRVVDSSKTSDDEEEVEEDSSAVPSHAVPHSKFDSTYMNHLDNVHKLAVAEQDVAFPYLANLQTIAQVYPGSVSSSTNPAAKRLTGGPSNIWIKLTQFCPPTAQFHSAMARYLQTHMGCLVKEGSKESSYNRQRQNKFEVVLMSKTDPALFTVSLRMSLRMIE